MKTQHNSGGLKQINKKHKGSAESKRNQHRLVSTNGVGSKCKLISTKADRINKNKQLQRLKKDKQLIQKRFVGGQSMPIVVGIIPLNSLAVIQDCLEDCFLAEGLITSSTTSQFINSNHIIFPKNKSQFNVLSSESRDIFQLLDIVKMSDIIIFALNISAYDSNNMTNAIDQIGQNTLTAIRSMGCPSPLAFLQGLPSQHNGKTQQIIRSAKEMVINTFSLPDLRIIEAGNSIATSRSICNITPKIVHWRSNRSYLIAEDVEILDNETMLDDSSQHPSSGCQVRLNGFVRSKPLYIHSLIHITGVGACKISKIVINKKNNNSSHKKTNQSRLNSSEQPTMTLDEDNIIDDQNDASSETDNDNIVIHADLDKQEPLTLEATPDVLEGDQNWPLDYEYNEVKTDGDRNIMNNDDDFLNYEQDKDDLSVGLDGLDDNNTLGDSSRYHQNNLLYDTGKSTNKKESKRFAMSAEDDLEFPDEVDTPTDVSARVRFARYRALQSFRTSPWHSKENLPPDYARIFQFENFSGTQKTILDEIKTIGSLQDNLILSQPKKKNSQKQKSLSKKGNRTPNDDEMMCEADDDNDNDLTNNVVDMEDVSVNGILSNAPQNNNNDDLYFINNDYIRTGVYVTIYLEEVPQTVANRLSTHGQLLLSGLLKHECKLSVLNFSIQSLTKKSSEEETNAIKSKELLLFQVGFREFYARPIFSESNLNCDKHKFERFLQPDRFAMASCYGPITMGNVPLLVFQCNNNEDGKMIDYNDDNKNWSLVASGAISTIDPDRIVLKKIILTGVPIRVRKRFAVIRHMFYDPMNNSNFLVLNLCN
eukprot:gene6017-8287_t